MTELETTESLATAKWQPLGRHDRRVVGVLVEKAKTTPENYPLSLNTLVNGCNQKSNRSPQMQLDEEQVSEAIDRLRAVGAVVVVEGDGRVDKYRHLLYEWLGVDKVELAVMAELLLRGAQTLGDLRARAARMEPIPGLAELRPIVDSLQQKELLLLLTPPGRGCVVTHALYEEQELTKLRAEHGDAKVGALPAPTAANSAPITPPPSGKPDSLHADVAELKSDMRQLRAEVEALKHQLDAGP